MFPRWQVPCNRIDLHIMASKTFWKQMSGKLFTLIQILQGEGFQNIFLKHGLALMHKRLVRTAGTFADLFSHSTCVVGLLPLSWAHHGEHQAGLGELWTHWRPSPGSRAKDTAGCDTAGWDTAPHLMCLTLCILPVLKELTAQTQQNPPKISNILHYVVFTTNIAACTAQAPSELSNKISNPAPLAWDAQIFCNSYTRSWLTAGAASWHCLLCTQNHTKQKQFGDFSFTK